MANLQQTLDALQPYVVGIRYLEQRPIIDVVFKDGWTVLESDSIIKEKGSQELNYYMVYSNKEGIGLDELLLYIEATIKLNIEREKKHELLKDKVNELKILFKKTPLATLKRLKFTFNEEELLPEINEFDLEENKDEPVAETQTQVIEEDQPVNEPVIVQELDAEERELLEEEQRAENFRLLQQKTKSNGQIKKISSTVELPPKRTIEEVVSQPDCDCAPDEFCDKCMDYKSL